MKNPPTNFKTPYGNVNLREEMVKLILLEIKDAYEFEFDSLQVAQGDEGSGKTHFMSQNAYVTWWFLRELELINYDWDLKLVYFSLEKLLLDMNRMVDQPFRIFILDESDELKRENWHKPEVKNFMSQLRRGRKFQRFLFLNLPQLKEMKTSILTTRTNKIYEVKMTRDFKTLDIERGEVNVYDIPRANKSWSFFYDDLLDKRYIRRKLSEVLKNNKDDFVEVPQKVLTLKIRFNKTKVFDDRLYKIKAAKETAELFNNNFTHMLTYKQAQIMLKIFLYLAENKLITDVFSGQESERRLFYLLRDQLTKIDSEV